MLVYRRVSALVNWIYIESYQHVKRYFPFKSPCVWELKQWRPVIFVGNHRNQDSRDEKLSSQLSTAFTFLDKAES